MTKNHQISLSKLLSEQHETLSKKFAVASRHERPHAFTRVKRKDDDNQGSNLQHAAIQLYPTKLQSQILKSNYSN